MNSLTGQRLITPVILSGGSGTRLWPLSRTGTPKQLLALTAEETMLQLSARRAEDGELFGPLVVVANGDHAEVIEAQLRAIGAAAAELILEPAARNTAPAIALAALRGAPEELLLIMPSDHVVEDVEAFHSAVRSAIPFAEEGWLMTFGISPGRPETGYGYIRRGAALGEGVFEAAAFVEKPNEAAAAAYCASGDHDWNGGIFLFRAGAYLAALEAQAPDVLAAARASIAGGRTEGKRLYPRASAFEASPSISIDYAVMEKAERVAVVPVSMGWSDVGSWDALFELGSPDEAGNVVKGDVLALDSHGSLIRADGPLVVCLGVDDLVVIATGDAVLIAPKGESQRVKEAVEALRARGHGSLDR